MALQGDVKTIPVRELLGWLARRRATGTLSLSHGMMARRFQLRGGRVVLASSAARETGARAAHDKLLGRLLVEQGLIDEAQLVGALARARRSRARLGKILERAGLVSPVQLAGVLATKAEGLLEETLGWTDGRFFFDDEPRSRGRAAVPTAIDLEGLVRREPPEPVDVADADVIEVREIAPRGHAA